MKYLSKALVVVAMVVGCVVAGSLGDTIASSFFLGFGVIGATKVLGMK